MLCSSIPIEKGTSWPISIVILYWQTAWQPSSNDQYSKFEGHLADHWSRPIYMAACGIHL